MRHKTTRDGQLRAEARKADFATLRTEIDNKRRGSEVYEAALNRLLDAGDIDECGCCGQHHPHRRADYDFSQTPFNGINPADCRDDRNRF